MIKIGVFEVDIEGIVTMATSVLALVFAYLAWKNQVRERLVVSADHILLNNNQIFQFDSNANGRLTISNVGYKHITVTDVKICIGKSKTPVGCFCDFKKINISIAPGEVKYYEYDRNALIEYISHGNFHSDDYIGWMVCTNTGRRFKCKTKNRVSDVKNINVGDKNDKA